MALSKNSEEEKNNKNSGQKEESWMDKANEYIDEKAEQLHKSSTYRKADESLEKATRKLFRKAGILWGKSERYLKEGKKDKDSD
ncbi:hypothetical protein [Maribellus sediminis]|uniref:hypothetical protein n=1 Tax=Maribellus sediminis TaxID=2696285 RepID=UPI00142FEB15|nr:hypothetical protein [Maribellus sediminis]